MVDEDGTTNQVVSCTIKTVSITFNSADVNKALGLPNEGLVSPLSDDEIRTFLTFTNYNDKVDLARLNKKHLRREWSFMFDTIIRVFTCRKTGWDQIPAVAQKIVHSLAYGNKLDVGKLILKELSTRLISPMDRRGNEIFLPHFIQSILDHKSKDLNKLEGVDESKFDVSKSVSKIIFGTLDKRNQVNVELKITPQMERVFAQQRLGQHTDAHFVQGAGVSQAGPSTSQPPPVNTNPPHDSSSKPIDVREPTENVSQKTFVSKKRKKEITLKVVSDNTETSEETETLGQLLKRKK